MMTVLRPTRPEPLSAPRRLPDKVTPDLAYISHFERLAVPARGRYVGQPALANEYGIVAVPPPLSDPVARIALSVGVGLLVGAALRRSTKRSR